jgi:hypothetical protein
MADGIGKIVAKTGCRRSALRTSYEPDVMLIVIIFARAARTLANR